MFFVGISQSVKNIQFNASFCEFLSTVFMGVEDPQKVQILSQEECTSA